MVQWRWVKGHQDVLTPARSLDIWSQMNILADERAKGFLQRLQNQAYQPDPLVAMSRWNLQVGSEVMDHVDIVLVYSHV